MVPDCSMDLYHKLNRIVSSLLWFAICLIVTTGYIQTTDLLHLASPCHLLPGLAFLVKGQVISGSTHLNMLS